MWLWPVALLGSILLSACLGLRLWSTERRLDRVRVQVERLAGGSLSHRVILAGNDRASALACQINRLVERVQRELENEHRRSEAHRQLLTNISHDLRTPITSIAGYVDALQRGLGDEPERYLAIVSMKTRELIRLTDDLFYLTRLDSGDLVLSREDMDLAETLKQVLLGFEPQLEEEAVEVHIDIPDSRCLFSGDETAVRRILTNIIANSLRHGVGKTVFGVEMNDNAGGFLVRVWDNGRGFSPEARQLFDRGSTYGAGGGSGLGLSIARDLADKQGIRLCAASEPYRRTCFQLEFPRPGI